MKYFLIEGIVNNPEKINDLIMNEHQNYTKKAMNDGLILISSLKSDMTVSVTIAKSINYDTIKLFYENEPFFKQGILTYNISELDIHYHCQDIKKWFDNL